MIGILQQQLEESQSTLLPPVPEVSDEEENYSTIHEEIDLIQIRRDSDVGKSNGSII